MFAFRKHCFEESPKILKSLPSLARQADIAGHGPELFPLPKSSKYQKTQANPTDQTNPTDPTNPTVPTNLTDPIQQTQQTQ